MSIDTPARRPPDGPSSGADGSTPEDHQTPEAQPAATTSPPSKPKEIGGPPGPEPTRYGDWQFNGRVTDF